MKAVLALGGNALLRRGERLDAEVQRRNVVRAARAVAEVARRHTVILTHGNGPQVGLLALQAEAYREVEAYPLDVLGAESEGMIGYLLAQELRNELPAREIAVLLTQVLVDLADPAFAHPQKPIGPLYGEREARELAERRGIQVAPDGDGWRRVVPSPRPYGILELETIRRLVEAGVVVVCGGGGGIPVARDADGRLHGVEAVIDKDRFAARLAHELAADVLVLLTDVDAVYADWPARREPVRCTVTDDIRRLDLGAGSMAPKVEAACDFVESGGVRAAIGVMQDALALVEGERGTQIEIEPC